MNKITKYLNQKAFFESLKTYKNNKPELNIYGEPVYLQGLYIKCRREEYIKDIQTSTGSIVRSSTAYYLDDSVSIKINDKIDGKLILVFEDFVDRDGRILGYKAIV